MRIRGLRLSKRTALVSLGIAATLAIGGTAAAASLSGPVDSSAVVHGCFSNVDVKGSHALVLQDAGTACPAGTTAVSWNQKGPAGPQGPAGPTGATGPQGPAGPQGLAGSGIDGGVITDEIDASGNTTCTDSDTFGPDTTTISVAPAWPFLKQGLRDFKTNIKRTWLIIVAFILYLGASASALYWLLGVPAQIPSLPQAFYKTWISMSTAGTLTTKSSKWVWGARRSKLARGPSVFRLHCVAGHDLPLPGAPKIVKAKG
jgi:hypothetical protein